MTHYHGGLCSIQCPHAEILHWPFKTISWSIYRTGLHSQTHQILTRIKPDQAQIMSTLVTQTKTALDTIDEPLFINNIQSYHQFMQQFQCYHPDLNPLWKHISSIHEVLAFKGCGALGMDTFIVLYHPDHEAKIHHQLDASFKRMAHTHQPASGIHTREVHHDT